MSDTPRVSVVIPHFNRARLLSETLESIHQQSVADWEVIIVDDGSEPEEWAAIRAMESDRIRVLQRTNGIKGPSRCRNMGAAEARGELLLFLDSDDVLAPWCLGQRLERVSQEPELGVWVFPVMLFHQRPGDGAQCWNRLEGHDDLDRFLRSGCC